METEENYTCVNRVNSVARMGIVVCICFFVLAALAVGGCVSPNLEPFVEATATLRTSVKVGGDMVIAPLTNQSVWDSTEKKYIPPGDPKHPAAQLANSWELREEAMDAVVVYSASLAAIGEASAKRQENAKEVVNSVKELASAIPGVSTGSSAAGDLLIMGLETIIEVKAYHDMAKAVEAASPAIELVADVLKKDFRSLAKLFESAQIDKLSQVLVDIRPVQRYYDKLLTAQKEQRERVSENVSDIALGEEQKRLDGLIAAVEPEITSLKTEKTALEAEMTNGLEFYDSTIKAIDAWSEAHASLKEYFDENRRPNLVLLAAHVEELKELVNKLKADR